MIYYNFYVGREGENKIFFFFKTFIDIHIKTNHDTKTGVICAMQTVKCGIFSKDIQNSIEMLN